MKALQGFYLNRNTTARKNFPLENLLFHLWASACNKSFDSPWRTDSKSRPKPAPRCAAPEGSRKLLPHRQVCEPGPPESHYSSTFLFSALINKNSRSHTVLLCQNLHGVWGPRHTQALEVRSSVLANIPAKENDTTSPYNFPLWKTVEMLNMESHCRCAPRNVHICTQGDVIISCCYRHTM